MKSLLAIILTLALCLCLAACGAGAPVRATGTLPPQTTVAPTENSTTQATAKPTQPIVQPTKATQPVATQPQQNMCYWCDEMPVGDFETYCVNCRCLKCDKLRKDGGGKYLYCRDHNCNEISCEYPAFEDSQYCSEHKCRKDNCNNDRWSDSEYCAHHK